MSFLERLFGPPDVEKLTAKRDVKGLIKALGYKKSQQESGKTRADAVKALGQIGDNCAVEPLIAALNDVNEYVRQAAAEVLGELKDTRAIKPLIVAFNDKDKDLRRALAEALVKIGASAVELLITALKGYGLEYNKYVRQAAAEVLGELKDTRAIEPLIVTLNDKDKDVGRAAAEALAIIGAPALEPLIAALKGRGEMRQTLAEVLVKIGAPAVKPLVAALGDEDRNVRETAAGALESLGWQPDRRDVEAAYWVAKRQWDRCVEIGAPAVEPLIVVLGGQDSSGLKDQEVRNAAAGALGAIGDIRAVEPLTATLRDIGVRETAVRALVKIGMPAVEPLIAALIPILKDDFNRWFATNELVKIGAPAVEPLITALEIEDWQENDAWKVRQAATKVLGKIGDVRAVEPLITALRDKVSYVSEGAEEALVKIGLPAVEPLIAALMDKDRKVRNAVAKVLRSIGWVPKGNIEEAAYWIAKAEGNPDKLSDLDYQTIKELLINSLEWDLDWQTKGQIAVMLVQHDMSVSDPILQRTIQELREWASKKDEVKAETWEDIDPYSGFGETKTRFHTISYQQERAKATVILKTLGLS